jgi:lipopolysaccharide heptosyltransferase I
MLYQPDSILIIKPSALGDIVLALPALTALRRSFPQARISWLVRPEYAELLRGHPDFNDIILFDRKFLAKSWYNAKAFGALLGLFRRLRKEHFELVIDFQGLFRTGFLAWVTGCRKRFGMAGAREFSHFFYTSRIRQDKSTVHLVDYYLKIAVAAGAIKDKVEFKLPADAGAEDAIRKILSGQGVNCDNYTVIVPGAAQPVKRWPIERFAQLADKIAGKFGSSIVATGSQGERQYIDTLKATAKSHILNLAGRTSVRELTALLKGASLVVSNDTGPGHIAAATGAPVVMIFGPTNPARVCPYARPNCVVAVEPDGRGMKADSFEPRHNIRHVTVGQVFEKVYGQIGKNDS